MKKIFLISTLFFVLFAAHAYAKEYEFDYYGNSLHVSVLGGKGTITYTNKVDANRTIPIRVCDDEFCGKDHTLLDDNFTVDNTTRVKTFSLPTLPTTTVKTYYLTLENVNTYKFYSDQYQLSFDAPADPTSLNLTTHITVPPTDTRDFYILFSTGEAPNSTKAKLYSSALLGKVDAQGNGSVTTVFPPSEAGHWFYFMMAVKNTAGNSYYFLGNVKNYHVGVENSVSAATLKFSNDNGAEQVVGQVDRNVNAHPETFGAQLEYRSAVTDKPYSSDPNDPDLVNKSAAGFHSHTDPDYTKGTEGINPDGSYYWTLSNVGIGDYWFRETFWDKDYKNMVGNPVVGKFNGANGVVVSGSAQDQTDFEKRSYRLLAPLPGLSVLLNPDLCQEQKNGGLSTGQICDINDFLNYVFKLMIGAAAVVLVLRLIFEGYRYITTDVPFLKVEAKSKIGQATAGLLLALSAWLILNTLNPKLVANDINIPTLTMSYEEEQYQSTIPSDTADIPQGSVGKCSEGVERISTKGGQINVCKSISANIKSMIDTAWAQGIKLSGGGFRTSAQQIALRAKHCGADNVYNKKAKCNPPTAYPGNSNHESGLAIDFMCDGVTIATQDNKCFLWLKENAGKYNPGLSNFSKEPWHWSINGH